MHDGQETAQPTQAPAVTQPNDLHLVGVADDDADAGDVPVEAHDIREDLLNDLESVHMYVPRSTMAAWSPEQVKAALNWAAELWEYDEKDPDSAKPEMPEHLAPFEHTMCWSQEQVDAFMKAEVEAEKQRIAAEAQPAAAPAAPAEDASYEVRRHKAEIDRLERLHQMEQKIDQLKNEVADAALTMSRMAVAAKNAKKTFDGLIERLEGLVTQHADLEAADVYVPPAPEPTLFDGEQPKPAAAEDERWKAVPIKDVLGELASEKVLAALDGAKVTTLGEMTAWINGGHHLHDLPGIGPETEAKLADQCSSWWGQHPEYLPQGEAPKAEAAEGKPEAAQPEPPAEQPQEASEKAQEEALPAGA